MKRSDYLQALRNCKSANDVRAAIKAADHHEVAGQFAKLKDDDTVDAVADIVSRVEAPGFTFTLADA